MSPQIQIEAIFKMPPKVDSKSLSASLEGLTNISSSIASDMQKMNEALESMKKQVDLVEKKQADHEVSIIDHGARLNNLESDKNHHEDRLGQIEEKVQRLEKFQSLVCQLEEQDKRMSQITRTIPATEMYKSSCIIVLHGLYLEKRIEDLNPSSKEDLEGLKASLAKGLSKRTVDFIFQRSREGHLENISLWTKGPSDSNYRYGDRIPEKNRNSVMFLCANRTQAVALEAEIRRSLISTFQKRKGTDQSFLETGLYSENSNVRTLHRMLLYRGKTLIEHFRGCFDQYRVSFRGGNKRGTSFSEVFLKLEVRASTEMSHDTRKPFFMSNDGKTLARNIWTDARNIRLSDPLSTWFPPRNPMIARVEKEINAQVATSPRKNKKCDQCDETFRSQQGLDEHKEEAHSDRGAAAGRKENVDASGEDEGEDEEVINAEEDLNLEKDGEFTPVQKKKTSKKEKQKQKDKVNEKKNETEVNKNQSKTFAEAAASPVIVSSRKQTKITHFSKPVSTITPLPIPL